jgi:hypothetical protein
MVVAIYRYPFNRAQRRRGRVVHRIRKIDVTKSCWFLKWISEPSLVHSCHLGAQLEWRLRVFVEGAIQVLHGFTILTIEPCDSRLIWVKMDNSRTEFQSFYGRICSEWVS